MKNIADSGILARIRKLAPQSAERAAPFRTPEEWREWQLAEGRRSCEEIDRQNRQSRAEKIFGRAGIQRLHRGCSFANYRIPGKGGKLWGSVSGREKRYFPFGTGFSALEAET